ncbi:flavodoxin [Clostridium sp. MCC353]|uniref:flavodoxin n=1 Tax=Clostridium sp. MCC353 TaxID=2592646 RepID=UPI001C033B0B|nr:flavodoxin [Clostridium sp. MCC353]MBT9779643.1 flavodoxin [Clostridium sp. MCC353]
MASKLLTVCYSYSGNTLQVAKAIQQAAGGELCCIYPRQPYPPGYQDLVLRARREIRDGYHPRLLPVSVKAEEYDIVFAGTPNWCGAMTPPLTSFLTGLDWAGKTVIPFCTHGGSGMGRVAGGIASLCPGSKILPGFSVMGDGGIRLEDQIRGWMEKIGFARV